MSDANPSSEAGAGAEALLGLAAQAGHAVRLPSLPSMAKQPPASHAPFLPAPPSLSLPTQPQPLQSQPHTQPQPHQPSQQTLQSQAPTAPLQPAPPLPAPPALQRERLPTLSEWADPAFRPFPPPLLAPLPDRWQGSAAPVPPPPSQYPYHNPWQSYPYPPPYPYYYQQQNMTYPVPPQPSVAPVPPPLALPTPPVVPPLRVPMRTDPVRDAASTNDSSAFPHIPQPSSVSSRDPLLDRLTTEASAVPKKTPSRARGLADLMNPTDTIPGSSEPVAQSRMEIPLIKPETIETKVTPVTVPSVPSAEPKLSDIVKEKSQSTKPDLAVIAGVSTEDVRNDTPQKLELARPEENTQKEAEEDNGANETKKQQVATSPDRRKPDADVEIKSSEETDVIVQSGEEETNQEKATTDGLLKENEEIPERKEDSSSQPDVLEEEDEDEDKEKEDVESGDEETRCPCGSVANSGTMIACDQCNTWQHSKCMGFRRSSEVPDEYYCHICRPDEIRPTCIAHPKYKDRSNRERSSLDRRDYESQLAAVKPVELRKIFTSDMRHKKTLVRSKAEVFSRYAAHVKNQFAKHRTCVIDGLVILLDMQRQDVVERLDAAVRRLKSDKQEDSERKRSGTATPNEGTLSEVGSTRTPGSSRGQTQKRPRPHSLSMDGSEGISGGRGESTEVLGDFDLGADASQGRNMSSREERKLQQTMKLFARLEERERERKKPRTGDISASPRVGPPSRSRTPKPHVRTVSPKSPATAIEVEEAPRKGASEPREDMEITDSPEQKLGPTSETRVVDVPQQNQLQEAPQPKLMQPFPEPKSALTSRSENEIGKKDREHRKDRLERIAPRRKESSSPDNLNGNANGRRRSILARERSQDGKRRRAGLSRESERRNGPSRELLKLDSSLDFSVRLPGPSVIGSRKISKTRLSKLEREIREKEEAVDKPDSDDVSNGSKKERLLEDARQEAMKKFLNGGRSPSPMKKRYRRRNEVREEESDDNTNEEQKEPDQQLKDTSTNGKESETLSVSMVVVSEKGSLPDRGQILESTRLILPGANGKMEDMTPGKADTSKTVCLKKRPIMLSANSEVKGAEDQNVSPKPTTGEKSSPAESAPSRLSSPSSPSPQKSPPSPVHRIASPKLRSCPPPVLRSPSFRSVPADDVRNATRSPSPLPSFRSQKLSPSVQRRHSQSPESDKKQREVPSPSRKLSSGSLPGSSADDKARQNSPESSAALASHEEQSKDAGESAPNESVSKPSLGTKTVPSFAAPPPLRSMRSVPPPPLSKNVDQSTSKTITTGKEVDKNSNSGDLAFPAAGKGTSGGAAFHDIIHQRLADQSTGKTFTTGKEVDNKNIKSGDLTLPAARKGPSGGAAFHDIIHQRLQEGLSRPSRASSSPSPRAPTSKYGQASTLPSSRANTSHVNTATPAPSVRGSAAKLGAALPLSSKPNLDGLRNSSGLSPRVSGGGHVYSRNYGPNFRSKPPDVERSWNSVPSFSSLKRQHGFGRGSRGGSLMGGKPGSFSGIDRGRHGHGRDGLSSYGRDDVMDKSRSGYRRDGPFMVRDDDKIQSGNPHSWNRSYPQRTGWGGGGPGHHSSGDGSGRGSRRGHHGN